MNGRDSIPEPADLLGRLARFLAGPPVTAEAVGRCGGRCRDRSCGRRSPSDRAGTGRRGVRPAAGRAADGRAHPGAVRRRPVHRLLGGPVASDAADVRRMLGKVRAELTRRAAGATDRRLWLLVIDEYTALQRGELGEEITSTVEAVAQEGRKLAIICLLLGQRWSATRSGGGDLRNTLTSAFVHRMRPEDARMLTGMRADQLPRDTLQLAPGECYVLDTSGDFTRVVTPRLTDADVTAFAARLTGSTTGSRPVPHGRWEQVQRISSLSVPRPAPTANTLARALTTPSTGMCVPGFLRASHMPISRPAWPASTSSAVGHRRKPTSGSPPSCKRSRWKPSTHTGTQEARPTHSRRPTRQTPPHPGRRLCSRVRISWRAQAARPVRGPAVARPRRPGSPCG